MVMQSEFESTRTGPRPKVLRELSELQKHLEALRKELENDADNCSAARWPLDEPHHALRQLPHELLVELQDQQIALHREKQRLEADRALLNQYNRELMQRESRVRTQAMTVQQNRRLRLARATQLLHERHRMLRKRENAVETSKHYARQVLVERESVMDLQRQLAQAEQRMIVRWGIQHAFGWVLRAALTLALMLMLSYFIAEQHATRIWAASGVVRHSGPVANIPLEDWAAQQRLRLIHPQNLAAAAIELRRNRYTGPAQPEYLQQAVQHLAVTAPAPNLIHLELHGEHREELAAILGALMRGYIAPLPVASTPVSTEAGPTAMQRAQLRIEQDAALAARPIQDNRTQLTAQYFGYSMLTILIALPAMALMYFLRAPRCLSAIEAGEVAQSDRWSAYHHALEESPCAATDDAFAKPLPLRGGGGPA